MELGIEIFRLTAKLPRKKDYGLTSQLRRASLSVSGNIAEAFGRKHAKEKLNFYYDARGSLSETKSHMIYGTKVGYLSSREFDDISALIEEIWKELNSVILSLKSHYLKSFSRFS